MKTKKTSNPILLFLLFFSTVVFSQKKEIKDNIGRLIVNPTGQKINYSKNDEISIGFNKTNDIIKSGAAYPNKSNATKDTINAKAYNVFSIMGTSIGRNSMHSVDIDNDGTIELVCSAATQTFGFNDYWYIMRYNSAEGTYDQIWTSPQYSKKITKLEVVDFNNDNNYKILLSYEDGSIEIYDGKTRDLLKKAKPVDEKINDLVYADADNDSKKDIVIACENNTYVLDADSFQQKFKIAQGSNHVRVGNVDADSKNEIVLSYGAVYKISGSAISNIWRFYTGNDGQIELSDIDGDSKLEIIFAENWYKINVYDVDTKTTKYTISTERDIDTLYVKDVNNDGIDEILYGDAQWGKVFCYNAVTRAQMWSVNNPEHGVAAISYADLNNDGKQELVWTAGWTSTGSDYMYIYNVSENKRLWRSDDIVGPFYAVAKGDVDNDGKDEIVGVSYESESGYESGILVIIDAQTNKLKWKSDGYFLKYAWTGLYNISIKDIDKDGQNEIIIAAGQTYTGQIWIIDGKNHTIKSNPIFSSDNISEFYSMTVDDVDNDGEEDLLAVSSSVLYAIRPSDWAILWKVGIVNNYKKPVLRSSDLNGDGKKETILCKGNLQIIYGSNQSIWTSTENNYVNFDLFDYNSDGTMDIVATTTDGHIRILDGISKNLLNDLNPETTEISSVRVKKVGNDLVYVYSCDGRINYYKNNSKATVTQFFGTRIGEIEGLKIYDTGTDFTEILFGTGTSIIRLNPNLANLGLATVDVKSDVIANNFSLYPVPAKDELFIDLQNSNLSNYSYEIINTNGQIVKSKTKAQNLREKIDVSYLPSGLYIVRLKSNNLYFSKKFIKE
ncbi:FG-GAP-like repeat-containing protein [Epilithonimonas sp.]|uniref:FG-GAP-like repeat-containing protein n=1 Tax=Epilithonimonas sp. TaxID=2894511 RepID=UPI0028964C8C|nr:FG-GAP-like repeat-containing protein [Epilithonimonas sp.]